MALFAYNGGIFDDNNGTITMPPEFVPVTPAQAADIIAATRSAQGATRAQSEIIAAAIEKTYIDVDVIYALAVGNRAEEYRQAEAAALAYQAAGYTGAVSEYVSAWAAANPPMTDAQAADVIIARAALLRSSMVTIRTQRFVTQAAIRASATASETDAALATWDAFVVSTKAALA